MLKKPTQLELQRRIQDELGLNIVTCGNCGSVIIHERHDELIECPDCNNISDPCDFPDVNY